MRNKQPLIKAMRQQYPKGTRIRLHNMHHEKAVPAGTEGSVIAIDDMAQIHVKWDNGSTLALIPNLDQYTKL